VITNEKTEELVNEKFENNSVENKNFDNDTIFKE
jgi:hypothetical protein